MVELLQRSGYDLISRILLPFASTFPFFRRSASSSGIWMVNKCLYLSTLLYPYEALLVA